MTKSIELMKVVNDCKRFLEGYGVTKVEFYTPQEQLGTITSDCEVGIVYTSTPCAEEIDSLYQIFDDVHEVAKKYELTSLWIAERWQIEDRAQNGSKLAEKVLANLHTAD